MSKNVKLHPVNQYADDVLNDRIPANKWLRLACKRQIIDWNKGKGSRGLWFDESAANDIIEFYPYFFQFYEGAFDGKPFYLTPHQKFIVGSLFGWKIKKTGLRRFRTAYIEEAKGMGKSPLAAGIGIYGLMNDKEPGAEIYSAATTRDQAGILFRDAKLYAESSSALREILTIHEHNISFDAENSFFRPVSSEHRGLDGKKPHMVLIDEIHEHPSDIVVRKMSAGTKTRRQSLIFEITNSGYDRNSICYQHHDYTAKILDGIIQDDAWFGVMTGLDVCPQCEAEGKTVPQDGCKNCDDWRDPGVWEKANPNLKYLGAPFLEYLKRQVREAVEMPTQQNIVKRLNFCIWTESETKWMTADNWNACGFPVDEKKLKGRACYAGLDLSTTSDVTALVYVFPPDADDGKYEVLCRFFLPADNMGKRVTKDKVPYDVWARDGYITLTPGNLIDYAFILSQIEQDAKDFNICELAFDRWGSQKITTDLQDLGFGLEGKNKTLIQFGQGFASMSPPTKECEKMVMGKEIAHGGNPVLAWMISNVCIKEDPAGNKKPDKEKSTERIDGAVAMVMAIGQAMLRGEPTKSRYENPEAKVIAY
jgi:phage terminase large subunit-like protein